MEGATVGGRFRLEALAASGGMGRVYRARDERNGSPAAIKLVRRAGLGADRFTREVQLLARLDHPAIVRYLDHGAAGSDEYFLAMEWLEGEDLAHRLARGPLAVHEALSLAGRVAEALAFAHARGVLHRDVKPANLFLVAGAVAQVKVVDFGIARPLGLRQARGTRGPDGDLSVTGIPVGTLGYMAPEQARGERFLDARVDVFALGCVLFECIAGRAPFVGEHAVAVLAKILVEEPPRLSRVAPQPVPRALDELVAAMLAHEPSRRPADGAALAGKLRALADSSAAAPAAVADVPAGGLTAAEKRLVSVVVLRPVAPLDEALRTRLAAAAAAFDDVLQPILDDALVSVRRGAGSAVDQVAQAARCALAFAEIAGVAAVAVATGFEAPGASPSADGAIDRAFLLLDDAVAGPPRVSVDELTAGLLDGAFAVERDGGRLRLTRAMTPLEPARRLLGRPTPLVGRDKELALLLATLDESIAEPQANAVLVVAPAGVGKSRLRWELVRAARARHPALEVWLARGDPLRQSTPLGILRDLVAFAARLRDDAPTELRRQKLAACVAQHLAGDARARVVELLGELTDAPAEEPSLLLQGARSDPAVMWTEMRRAWHDFLDAKLRSAPLLVVIDDVQWADAPTLQVLEETIARRQRPLMLLLCGRPEATAQLGASWDERGLSTMRLGLLGRRASEALVRHVLGADVDDTRVAAVVERGGGHALLVEELLRAEVEGRGRDTPPTTIAILQERLERFEADARHLLRAASVFGLEFSRDGVATLVGDRLAPAELDRWLEILRAREVVGAAEHPRLGLQQSFAFRHDLLREAVYVTLTDEDLRRGHRLAAQWLQSAGVRDAATLASHHRLGGELERAAAFYAQAAAEAHAREDFVDADRHIQSALDCGANGERLGALRRLQGTMAIARHTIADAERYTADALTLLRPGTPPWFDSATVMVTVASFGRQQHLGEIIGRVLAAGMPPDDALGMPAVRAWALSANMLYFAGQPALAAEFDARIERAAPRAIVNDASAAAWLHYARHVRASYCGGAAHVALDEAARAAAVLEHLGDRAMLTWVQTEEARAAGIVGDFARGERLVRPIVARPDALVFARALAQHRLARLRAWAGALDEALALQREADDGFGKQGMPVFVGVGLNQLAMFLLEAGEREAAAHAIDEALELLLAAPPVRVYALATAARIATARGDVERALGQLAEADAQRAWAGLLGDGEAPLELAWIEALVAAGRRAEAARRAAAASARLYATAAAIADGALRKSFLECAPDHVRLLAFARDLETR